MPVKSILLLLAMLADANAGAADAPAISRGERLAATCVACHGTRGDTQGTTLPRLAGQSQQALEESLRSFKTGARPATIMNQIAKGYTDEQIALLASYFAARK